MAAPLPVDDADKLESMERQASRIASRLENTARLLIPPPRREQAAPGPGV